MAGELVKRDSGFASIDLISGDNFERVERVATGLAASGVFKDVSSTQNAMAKILIGADLGLTPTQALMNIDVVEGNARVRSNQLAAWVRKHPDYDYKVVEHDAQHCAIDFTYKGESAGRSEYTIADADLAGLVKKDKPRSAWMAHPKSMLFARAMSNGVKWYAPDLTGGIAVYTEGDEFTNSTAVEIGAGEGSGETPPWDENMDEERAAKVDGLVAWAESKNLPLFGDLATVRMRLNGQKVEAVDEWIAAAEEQRASVEAGS